jgi:hypothetical protein
MSLVLKPPKDGAPDVFQVTQGDLEVGRLYKRSSLISSGSQWLWSLSGVPVGPPDLEITGFSETKEEALTALGERWASWWKWARLSEA